MSESTVTCPTCRGDAGPVSAERGTHFLDQFCDTCSALLRLRFFRGALIDVEDLDYAPAESD